MSTVALSPIKQQTKASWLSRMASGLRSTKFIYLFICWCLSWVHIEREWGHQSTAGHTHQSLSCSHLVSICHFRTVGGNSYWSTWRKSSQTSNRIWTGNRLPWIPLLVSVFSSKTFCLYHRLPEHWLINLKQVTLTVTPSVSVLVLKTQTCRSHRAFHNVWHRWGKISNLKHFMLCLLIHAD